MHPFIRRESVCAFCLCVYRCVYRSDDDSNDTHTCTCIHCKCARCTRTWQKQQMRAHGTSQQQSDNVAVWLKCIECEFVSLCLSLLPNGDAFVSWVSGLCMVAELGF